MQDGAASRTAMGVAVLRAAHQVLDAPPLILTDPVATNVIDAGTRDWIATRPPELLAAGARALRSHIVIRSRFAEDRLEAAVRRGVTQYVVLGAGYDTFAYRQPAWAGGLSVFEVDFPATQADKRARIEGGGVCCPANVTFVPVDFARDVLADSLAAAGFNPARPALFAWLGVTMYLEAEANDAVFRDVASRPAGSELVFTFAPEAGPEPPSPGSARLAAMAAEHGEPWRTYYNPEGLSTRLAEFGFSSVWMPTPAELAAAYFLNRPDDLPIPRRRTLAAAIV